MYKVTATEKWINTHYLANGILTPEDIDTERFAAYFDIKVIYRPMPARYDMFGDYMSIVLDSRQSKEEIKEQFFRMLYFIMFCRGHQTAIDRNNVQKHYEKAITFTMYTTLPYFLVKQYEMCDPNIHEKLSNDFVVTEELCTKRIEGIRNRILFESLKT